MAANSNSTMKIVLMVLAAIVVLYLIYVLAALYLAGKIIEKGNQAPAQPQPNTIATPTQGPSIT